MIYVGIDVAKNLHYCTILFSEESKEKTFPFENNREGFNCLINKLSSLGKIEAIGLEARGHYHEALKDFLENHGYALKVFNHLQRKKFRDFLSLRNTKTDSID